MMLPNLVANLVIAIGTTAPKINASAMDATEDVPGCKPLTERRRCHV